MHKSAATDAHPFNTQHAAVYEVARLLLLEQQRSTFSQKEHPPKIIQVRYMGLEPTRAGPEEYTVLHCSPTRGRFTGPVATYHAR